VTPSLRNLNQDASMADALVYYLTPGETFVTTPEDENPPPSHIQLSGGGLAIGHGSIIFDRAKSASPITYVPGAGVAFVNGTQLTSETTLKHNDRLILGSSQAFRVVDPIDPEASKPQKALIDWDLAQTELAEAMGTAVDLKVEEEVAKKKAELDAQLKAMEEKFARENEALKQQLAKADPNAAQQQMLKQMDSRKKAIESFRAKAKMHINEYKRDLIRLEDDLQRTVPLVKEANQMGAQLGRCVKFHSNLVTYIPESKVNDPLSPVEELLTQKVTELMVCCTLHNPRTDMKREWFWQPQVFSDKISQMRTVWQKWMLEQTMIQLHTSEDPFWSKPVPQLIGSAYLYLAPIAYCTACSQWVPVVDHRGTKQGELRVHLTPTAADFKTACSPTADPDSLLGKDHFFKLTIEQARGLMDCPNKNVRVEYTFSNEEGKRSTPAAQGKKFDPKFHETHDFTIKNVAQQDLTYLCKDAIKFEVWGEIEDVDETDVAEAVAMELPPETFEFFLAHDVRKHQDKPLCLYKDIPEISGRKQMGHIIEPGTAALELVFSVAQADKHFKVCEIGRVRVGGIKDAVKGTSVDSGWASLAIHKQGRASETDPWVVSCDWTTLPKCFANEGVYLITLQSEIQEVERLGLEEPLQLSQEVCIQVKTPAAGESLMLEMKETEVKTRFRHSTVVQEIYMGQFEVSDAAVNLAMMSLRDQSDEGSKDVIKDLETNVQKLQVFMVEECSRQYEDLSLRVAQLGLDIKQSLDVWQLPSELLGLANSGPQDVEGLKKEVENLRNLLRAANERIAYLETANGTNRAQGQIAALRKQMLEQKKANSYGASAAAESNSKACVIS